MRHVRFINTFIPIAPLFSCSASASLSMCVLRDTLNRVQNPHANSETTKINAIFVVRGIFSCLLSHTSRNLITIVMNLWLAQVSVIGFFSLPLFLRSDCAACVWVRMLLELKPTLGECTFAHWLPVRVSNIYIRCSSSTSRSWSDSTVSCCRMICDYIHDE